MKILRNLLAHCSKPGTQLVAFALSLGLLTATGRLGNADAADQFYAAHHWVLTGQLGSIQPPGGAVPGLQIGEAKVIPRRFFWAGPDGLFYQTHDLGNVLMFLPAACLAAAKAGGSLAERLEDPPDYSKAAASLLFST